MLCGADDGRDGLFSVEGGTAAGGGAMAAENMTEGLGEGLLDEEDDDDKGFANGSKVASTKTPGSADFFKNDLESVGELT